MKDFCKGVITGAVAVVIIFGIILLMMFLQKRDKELIEYGKKQMEIEALREDYLNSDYTDFLENPDVRRAADGAAGDFDRKRDEILERFRSGIADK